ncbi:hypothetical protein TNCT_613061 [Trichonephila clavata]|uniref:Uncharacterized protein n=1 Tax=Trichonephila clavata TaxID=2740835 RepID=A0A8X6K102_TRICU|nr:hypothetical protein TNCT_613061 [Trichonephila clavata]
MFQAFVSVISFDTESLYPIGKHTPNNARALSLLCRCLGVEKVHLMQESPKIGSGGESRRKVKRKKRIFLRRDRVVAAVRIPVTTVN